MWWGCYQWTSTAGQTMCFFYVWMKHDLLTAERHEWVFMTKNRAMRRHQQVPGRTGPWFVCPSEGLWWHKGVKPKPTVGRNRESPVFWWHNEGSAFTILRIMVGIFSCWMEEPGQISPCVAVISYIIIPVIWLIMDFVQSPWVMWEELSHEGIVFVPSLEHSRKKKKQS